MRLTGYRRDIDGLRAIAVLAVVLYHAGFGVPGGFVGVDVFFVISGYLITSIILRELGEGTFTLRGFWMRRVRRLMPALIAVVTFTLAVAATFMLPADFEKLAKATIAQVFGVSNFYFWQDTDYFAGAAEMKPLLHTWSLAVEEQFYVVLPLALLALWSRRRRVIAGVLVATAVASLAWSVFEVAHAPSTAFFLLPSRAWELLAGSLLVFIPRLATAREGERPGVLPEVLAWGGLVMILASCLFFSKETPFPGPSALLPVVGSCLVMFANGHGQTSLGRFLTWWPMVGVGAISYSLYLWHWPLFAFARYWFYPLPAWLAAVLVVASIALAVVSYRYVETPFRRKTPTRPDRWLLKRAIAAQAVIVAIAIAIDQKEGFYSRVSGELAELSEDIAWANVSNERVAAGRLKPLGVEDESLAPRFLLWGDSHAKVLARLLSEMAADAGVRGLVVAHHFGRANIVARPEEADLHRRREQVEKIIVDSGIRYVFIVQRWEKVFAYHRPGEEEYARYSAEEKAAMDRILPELTRRLGEAGCQVYLLDQIPRQPGDDLLRAELFRSVKLGLDDAISDKRTLAEYEAGAFWRPYLEACLAAPNVHLLDVRPYCFDEAGKSLVFVDGKSCYRDDNHLTSYGTRILLAPLLQPVFEEIGEAPR